MRFLLLLVAAVVAIFAGVAALQLSAPTPAEGTATNAAQATAPNNVLTVDVLVARAPIPVGTEITAAMIDKQPWPENLVLEGFITATGHEGDVVGKVTRSAFQAREPLIANKLADTEDSGFLAARLPEGMRAITIATDAVNGVAGFVFPGDRIDILFTHNIPDKGKESSGSNPAAGFSIPGIALPPPAASGDSAGYAEVLAGNIPVLAVNVRDSGTSDGAGIIPSPESIAAGIVGGGGTITPSSMTLQVTDMQAEKIRLAEHAGNISIVLRSIKDRANTATPPATDLASLTQIPLSQAVQQKIQTQNDEVKVIRGGTSPTPSSAAPNLNLYSPLAR